MTSRGEHGFILFLLLEFAFPYFKSLSTMGHTFHILFKFYVLREINSWLVKVTLYDSTYKLCVDVCRAQLHSFIMNQHSRGMLSSSVTALRAWSCDGYIHFHLGSF